MSVPGCADGNYVTPAIVRMPGQTEVVRTETFAASLRSRSWDALAGEIAAMVEEAAA